MKTYKAGELREDMLVVPVHMLEGFALVPVEVKRDADRYRFIRNADECDHHLSCAEIMAYAGEDLDIAIDAAMLSAAPKGCTKPGCFPYCDCGTIDDYMPPAAAPKGDSHE